MCCAILIPHLYTIVQITKHNSSDHMVNIVVSLISIFITCGLFTKPLNYTVQKPLRQHSSFHINQTQFRLRQPTTSAAQQRSNHTRCCLQAISKRFANYGFRIVGFPFVFVLGIDPSNCTIYTYWCWYYGTEGALWFIQWIGCLRLGWNDFAPNRQLIVIII